MIFQSKTYIHLRYNSQCSLKRRHCNMRYRFVFAAFDPNHMSYYKKTINSTMLIQDYLGKINVTIVSSLSRVLRVFSKIKLIKYEFCLNSQLHLADRALSFPTEPNCISQASVHTALLPLKFSPDQISIRHDARNNLNPRTQFM